MTTSAQVGAGLSPAVPWAVATWMGALVGWDVVTVDGTVALGAGRTPLAVVVGMAVALLVRDVVRRRGRALPGVGPSSRVGSPTATVVGILVIGIAMAGLAGHRRMAMSRGPLVAVAATGGQVAIQGRVTSEPVVRDDGSAWSLVTVTSVDGTSGRWRALWSDQQEPPPVGADVAMRVTARPLGDEDFDGYLRRRHAVVAVTPVAWEVTAPPAGVLGMVESVRARIRAAAATGLGGDAAGLAVGLVTGDTRLLSQAAHDDMQATGLTHLVAVSGSNVALVAGVVAALAGSAPARLRQALVAAAIVAFTITTRAEPSVLRAAVMAAAVMGAGLVGRPRAGVHALAVAVMALLVADPAAAGSLGLVLSVTATLGVLVVAPVVDERLPAWLPRPVSLLVAATLGAQVTVAPVLLAGIGDVPLAAVPANLVAVPAAAAASLAAVLAAVAAQLDVGVGASLMALAGPPLAVVLEVAALCDVGPVLSAASPGGLVIAAAATAGVVAVPRSRLRRSAAAVVVGCVLVTTVAAPDAGWQPPDVLAVTAIDVGQGDALLVTTASGHRVLVDTGRDQRAADWLRRRGIGHLDLLVVTHGDDDHAGGLDAVLDVVDVAVVWVSTRPEGGPEPPNRDPPPPGTVAVRTGHHARVGSATIEVLGPPGGHDLVATEGGRNDRSVVLRVVEGERVALLPGDVEHAAQRWLLAAHEDLAAGMLLVPHHGAATSDLEFLAATRAVEAVISVGRDNDYGHPRAEVVSALEGMGATVHRTDVDGTVTVVVPPPR